MIAPHVAHIDAYELSSKMVDVAKKTQDEGIHNIDYFVKDLVLNSSFEKIYNICICLGLFTCIIKDEDMDDIVKNIANALIDEKYLLLKDTLNKEKSELHLSSNYGAHYRSEKHYLSFFERAGFKLVSRDIYDRGEMYSMWCILKKD